MNFLAAMPASDDFAPGDGLHQIKPLAVLRAMRQTIDAGWPERTNRKARAKAVAVDELLDGGFVRSVVARCSRGMILVERPVVKDSLVDGTRRNEDESSYPGFAGLFEQSECTHDIPLDELENVPLGATKTSAWSAECRVNHGIASGHQRFGRYVIIEFAGQPFYGMSNLLQP
jgi:hypothetical protein